MNSGAPTGNVFEIYENSGRPVGCVGEQPNSAYEAPSFSVQSGIVVPDSFSGEPLLFTVVFDVAFPNTSYAIILSGVDARVFTYQSKTINGFTINTNANDALLGEVSWLAIPIGVQ